MDINRTITTDSSQSTQEVGEKLATAIIADSTVPHICCLYGELGAGKTTLLQGFAKSLGLPSRLVSPTFLIMKRYSLPNLQKMFYHIDLYRLHEQGQFQNLGLEEIFYDPNAIIVVEWAERLQQLLPQHRIDIHMTVISEHERAIRITYV